MARVTSCRHLPGTGNSPTAIRGFLFVVFDGCFCFGHVDQDLGHKEPNLPQTPNALLAEEIAANAKTSSLRRVGRKVGVMCRVLAAIIRLSATCEKVQQPIKILSERCGSGNYIKRFLFIYE